MTAPEPVGLTDGQREQIKVGLHDWLDTRRQTAYRRVQTHLHGPGCHEPDEEGVGFCDSFGVGMLAGIGWPGDLEKVVAEVVAPILAAERAAHEAQVQAGDRLREAIEALATKYEARYGPFPNGYCHSLPIVEVVADLAALAAAAPTPPQEHDCTTCVDCIHNGNKCCGCYDGVCCQGTNTFTLQEPRTHGGNHAPLGDGNWLTPGFCAGCDEERQDAATEGGR